jgi:Bacterial extracellular solute-binding proteins, family 3
MPFELVQPGALTIGVDASAPGALHSDPSAPGFAGFEVDLMTEVAGRLGLRYRYRGGRWAGLIDELRQGRLDAIVTAATITEERKRLVDFSEPYLEYRLGIAVRRGSAIRTLADLGRKRLAVRIATTAEQFARARAQAAEILSYHTNVEACEALPGSRMDRSRNGSPTTFQSSSWPGPSRRRRHTTRSCSAKATMPCGGRSIRCSRRSKPMVPTIDCTSGGSAGGTLGRVIVTDDVRAARMTAGRSSLLCRHSGSC